MKTYRLHWTDSTKQDLAEIVGYLTEKTGSYAQARRFVIHLRDEIKHLCVNPHHQIIDESPFREAGLRRYTIKNYVAYYLVDEGRSLVVVLAVLYGGQFWQRLLPERMRAWPSRRQRTLVRVTARIR
ncbi:type II toxin-antitoxin system RelE/ParE family toxin [bacterium]|nr:type II toxin-antitoxin system RelE/ParE family toxin [bacterium]